MFFEEKKCIMGYQNVWNRLQNLHEDRLIIQCRIMYVFWHCGLLIQMWLSHWRDVQATSGCGASSRAAIQLEIITRGVVHTQLTIVYTQLNYIYTYIYCTAHYIYVSVNLWNQEIWELSENFRQFVKYLFQSVSSQIVWTF